MVESEVDKYKLNYNERNLSLKVCLVNNQKLSMIITYKDTLESYSTLISLQELKKLSVVFNSSKNIKDALMIIKNAIESNEIMVVEDCVKKTEIEIQFNITLASGEYPPFEIVLLLENNKQEKIVKNQKLQSTYEYQGNKEGETGGGNFENNVTENVKQIIKSKIKPPIMQLEYIEPILIVHYPDGTTKNTPLPPRIQNISGEKANISEEEFQSIQKLMNQNTTIKNFSPIKNNSSINRTNSLSNLKEKDYSNQTIPNPFLSNMIQVNKCNNADKILRENNQGYLPINNTKITFEKNINEYPLQRLNRALQINNPSKLTYYQKPKINFNNVIERRPRMTNINDNGNNKKGLNRSSSTPSIQNIKKFNPNKVRNIYKGNQVSYQFQNNQLLSQNQYNNNNNIKTWFNRNAQNQKLNNNRNIIKKSDSPRDKLPFEREKNNSNIEQIKSDQRPNQSKQSQIQDSLSLIEKQQKKVQEIQKKLAEIKEKQQKFKNYNSQYSNRSTKVQIINEKNIQNSPRTLNEKMNTILNQQQIKNISSYRYKQMTSRVIPQQFRNQNSNEIRSAKTQMLSEPENPQLKAQISSPISSKALTLNIEIYKQGINCQEMEGITLPNSNQNRIEKNEENVYQISINNQIQNQSIQQVQENESINIEALFMTGEGKIIFKNGLLRGIIHKYAEIDNVVSKIQDALLKGIKFNLVYKAFDLDDKSSTFHEKCDNLDMSLVLIETDKDVRFGGFTTQSWKGNCCKKMDNNSFVFNLDNNKIFDVIENQHAIGCYPNCGPIFLGCQIRIYDNFFSNGGTTCHKGLNFKTNKDYELNNGEQKYLIKDIEIYSLETIDIE